MNCGQFFSPHLYLSSRVWELPNTLEPGIDQPHWRTKDGRKFLERFCSKYSVLEVAQSNFQIHFFKKADHKKIGSVKGMRTADKYCIKSSQIEHQ